MVSSIWSLGLDYAYFVDVLFVDHLRENLFDALMYILFLRYYVLN